MLTRGSVTVASFAALLCSISIAGGAAAACYQHPLATVKISNPWGTPGATAPHRGCDYAAPKGTAIMAVADGTVTYEGLSGCLGNVLVIQHADGVYSGYTHMADASPFGVGDSVSKGQNVGAVGTTGSCTTGPHLHLTFSNAAQGYASGVTFDPYAYIESHSVCGEDPPVGGSGGGTSAGGANGGGGSISAGGSTSAGGAGSGDGGSTSAGGASTSSGGASTSSGGASTSSGGASASAGESGGQLDPITYAGAGGKPRGAGRSAEPVSSPGSEDAGGCGVPGAVPVDGGSFALLVAALGVIAKRARARAAR